MKLIPKEFEGFNRVLTGVVVVRPPAVAEALDAVGI